MTQITLLKSGAFSLSFLLLAFASAHAQATPAAPPEAPSPLSAIATWLNHLGDAGTSRCYDLNQSFIKTGASFFGETGAGPSSAGRGRGSGVDDGLPRCGGVAWTKPSLRRSQLRR